MKQLFTVVCLVYFIVNIQAQELHTVNAGNFFFNPSALTIQVGDTVQWINEGGFHNINAENSTLTGESFNNPESFMSEATGDAILLTRVFTVPGTYNYDCAVGNHAEQGMVGMIIVNADGPIMHTVEAGNFFFNPDTITIEIGDTVQWINTDGFHNVNADVSTLTGESFNNPESFASEATGDAILLTRVFTEPGTYDYDCAVGNHAEQGMVATLIVNGMTTSVDDVRIKKFNAFNAYYDAADENIRIQFELENISEVTSVSIINIDGKVLRQDKLNTNIGENQYNIELNSSMPTGYYVIQLFVDGTAETQKLFIR